MTLRERVVEILGDYGHAVLHGEGKPWEVADAILSLIAEDRRALEAEVRDGKRAAFVAGADWAVGEDYGEMGNATAVRAVTAYARRRYGGEA